MPQRNKGLPTPSIRAYDVPFVAFNAVRSIAGTPPALLIVVLEVGDGYFCIEHQIGIDKVVQCVVKKASFPAFFQKTQDDLAEVTATLKSKALERSATLEAIQLLGQLTPLTEEEEYEMAKAPVQKEVEKNAKLSKAKKESAPKEKKEGAGRAPAEFSYKVMKKENAGREGSWTRHMIDVIMDNTDTASARAANAKAKGATPKGQAFSDKALDFAWAKEQGYISY